MSLVLNGRISWLLVSFLAYTLLIHIYLFIYLFIYLLCQMAARHTKQ